MVVCYCAQTLTGTLSSLHLKLTHAPVRNLMYPVSESMNWWIRKFYRDVATLILFCHPTDQIRPVMLGDRLNVNNRAMLQYYHVLVVASV